MSHYKPYPAYKDSGVEWVGEVPEHWVTCSLKHVLEETNSGGTPDTDNPEFWCSENSGTPWVSISDMSCTELVRGTQKSVTQTGIDSKRLKVFPKGTLLFSMYASLGHVAELDMAATTNQAILGLVPNAEIVDQGFLKRWLQSVQPYLIIGASNATQDNLNAEKVKNLPCVKISISEQKSIAACIDVEVSRIDALVSKKTRFIELLKKKRQALITHAVTKGLDPNVKMKDSGVEWIGEVPEHWMAAPIKYVGRLESGHTPSRSVPAYWENCTVPWFTLADIWQVRKAGRKVITETSEMVSELGLANSSARRLPSGTVVLSRTASVGFPAILGCEMATSQDFAAWICGKRLHNEFLYFCLIAMKGELNRLMMGSTHKTIYMPDIEQFRCTLPPISEQCQIAVYIQNQIDRFQQLTEKTQHSIDLLKKRRSAFITAAVTGKIDLRESV